MKAKTPAGPTPAQGDHVELTEVELDAAVGGTTPRGLEPCLKTVNPCVKVGYIPCVKAPRPG